HPAPAQSARAAGQRDAAVPLRRRGEALPPASPARADRAGMIRPTIALVPCFLAGCIAQPKTVEYYDYDCNIQTKKMILTAGQLNCQSRRGDCVLLMPLAAVGSGVVSGSAVVVGNTLYWLEKQGKCTPKGPASLVD